MLPRKLQKIAVALKYKYSEDKAPYVVASGEGRLAEAIINKAQSAEVPIHEDKGLAQILKHVKVGNPIPEELYEVVAQIIAMVYRIDKKASPGHK